MHTVEKAIYDLGQQTPGMFPNLLNPPFTMADMEKIVDNFDLEYLKPPVHHGHPKGDATDMSLGYISSVRLDGEKLMATMKLDDSVKEMFDDGKLLAHSSELYRNLDGRGPTLRGLGLLGATPPRQKKLPSLFSETDEKGDYDIIVFSDNQEPGEIPMPAEPTPAPAPIAAPPAAGTLFTEEQIKAREDAAVKAALEANEKSEEFAEAEKAHAQLKKDHDKLQKDLDAQRAKDRTADHEAFAESDKMAHATPIQKTCAVALLDELEPADGKDHELEVFAEDGTSVKFSPRELIIGLTKPAGKSIQDTLRGAKAGAEAGGSKAGEMTIENFAEHEATKDNADKAIALWCKENEGKKKSDAVIYFSEHEDHSAWFHKAANATNAIT